MTRNAARNYDESWANDFDEAVSSGTAGDVAALVAGVAVGSATLSGIASYRNRFDKTKGLPTGLDWGFAGIGILAAVFGGEVLGETISLGMLGIGLSGVASISAHGGTLLGDEVAKMMGAPADSGNPKVKGHDEIHTGGLGSGIGDMSPEVRAEYEAYAGR